MFVLYSTYQVEACGFPGTLDHQGLRQQHPGNADKGTEQQDLLDGHLSWIHVRCQAYVLKGRVLVQHHVDEGDENRRRATRPQMNVRD